MRYLIIIGILLINSLTPLVFAAEHKSSGDIFSVDFSSVWKVEKSLDPEVILRLENGKSFFEFSKLESELSEYYLKTRVKEQIESLRGKGNLISGSVEKISIHGAANFYYTSYESMGQRVYIGFFTYNNASFVVSAKGLSDSDLKRIVYTIRKPGEKIIIAKPKPEPKPIVEESQSSDVPELTGVFRAYDKKIDDIMGEVNKSTGVDKNFGVAVSTKKFAGFKEKTEKAPLKKIKIVKKEKPLIDRSPVPAHIWFILVALWVLGLVFAKNKVKSVSNPIIPPAPKDIPPDFFFPFLISRFVTLNDTVYSVVSRQRQNLTAYFSREHEFYFVLTCYGLLFMHIAWSVTALISSSSVFTNIFLGLPFGGFFAAFPEVFFFLPLFMGISVYLNKEQKLRLSDNLGNLILEIKKDEGYGRLRDGNGKEVATLVRQGSLFKRQWEFVDTDNRVVFTIKDKYPEVFILRKFFGQLGGILRSRYAIYADDRLAGFVFIDPTSSDRFQIHWDYAFSRLAHPAQILMSVLYILSKERDPSYPSIF
ncbi:MAG: hypothetical protein L6420_03180 [Elusimicrobia bacterium]|nr:hypothetical protein [Elusimicrobiota bacterium]